MTMKDNSDKVRRKLPRITEKTIDRIINITVLFLVAGMFTFHLGVWDLQKQQISKIEQQADDLTNILNAIDRNTKQGAIDQKARSQAATIERQFVINQTLQVKKIVIELGDNLTKAIQDIDQRFQNHTEQVKQHDQSLRHLVENPPSDREGQAKAIKNIEKVLENQKTILQRIDNNTVVSNTTVTAIK